VLIHNAVEIKLIVIDFKPYTCPHGGIQGKHYTLMDLPVHGEQNEPSHIFIAVIRSHEL